MWRNVFGRKYKPTLVSLTLISGAGVTARLGPGTRNWQTLRPISANLGKIYSWVVVSKTFYFHPEYLGKWSNLTNIFQMGWFNHQLDRLKYFGFMILGLEDPFQKMNKSTKNPTNQKKFHRPTACRKHDFVEGKVVSKHLGWRHNFMPHPKGGLPPHEN